MFEPVENSARIKLTRKEQQDLDVQIEFLEGVVRRAADYVDALQVLGDHYTRRGRIEDGLKVDERLTQLQPENPVIHYNLACSYARAGRVDNAAGALARALDLGFSDFHWLARDPDLRSLRDHPIYQTIQAKIRSLNAS